jgi:hypothetical protein
LHETTYEADELRRSWKNCSCPIDASRTLGARFKRRNTERNRWDESKTVVRAWEDADTWDGEPKIERLRVVAAAAPVVPDRRVTIEGRRPSVHCGVSGIRGREHIEEIPAASVRDQRRHLCFVSFATTTPQICVPRVRATANGTPLDRPEVIKISGYGVAPEQMRSRP